MKKNLTILLSSFVLISLISCNNNQPSRTDSSKTETTSERSEISSPSSISSSSDISPESSSDPTSTSIPKETYYHVTFVNYDESVLYEVDVLEGSEAVYSGETPTREEDDEFTYEFQGWDKEDELKNVVSDVTTMAVYKSTGKEGWGPIHWD